MSSPGVRTDWGIVLGGAACVWEDVERLESMLGEPWPGLVAAVNEAGCEWPRRLDHWVSFHSRLFPEWEARRMENGHPMTHVKWARQGVPQYADRRVEPWDRGSSAMLATKVLRVKVGCSKIVLCGCPMTQTPHFHDRDDGMPWQHADGMFERWKKTRNQERMQGIVKSMSGRTMGLLGSPTLEWLHSEEEGAEE